MDNLFFINPCFLYLPKNCELKYNVIFENIFNVDDELYKMMELGMNDFLYLALLQDGILSFVLDLMNRKYGESGWF